MRKKAVEWGKIQAAQLESFGSFLKMNDGQSGFLLLGPLRGIPVLSRQPGLWQDRKMAAWHLGAVSAETPPRLTVQDRQISTSTVASKKAQGSDPSG